jgi:hypothetical protein
MSNREIHPIKLTMAGLGPWSYSKMKSLQNCPLQFYLKYIHKMKVEYVQSPEAMVGSAAHKVLEYFVIGKPLDSSFREVKEEFLSKMGQELWEQVERLELSISEFKRRLDEFDKNNPIKRVFAEMRIGVTEEFEPTTFFADNVFFRGIVDLALLLENGDAVFIDHKKGGSAEFGIKNYTQQLDSQKVLFHGGITPINGATAGIHFIEAGQIRLGEHHTREEIEKVLKHNLLLSIDSAVHKVIDMGYFKHKACGACKWCDYAVPCKSGALKEIELSTKVLVESCLRQ